MLRSHLGPAELRELRLETHRNLGNPYYHSAAGEGEPPRSGDRERPRRAWDPNLVHNLPRARVEADGVAGQQPREGTIVNRSPNREVMA